MAEIGFYHLTRSTRLQALPRLLARTLAAGQRALVVTADTAELSATLWGQPEWLPHGTVADGDPDLQPIWLSSEPDAANGARYLFLLDDAGAATNRLASFDRVFDLFDGNNPVSVAAARARWKAAKAAEHVLSYWQQGKTGWQKKA